MSNPRTTSKPATRGVSAIWHYAVTGLVLAAGLAASITTARLIEQAEAQRIQGEQEIVALTYAAALEQTLGARFQVLETLGAFVRNDRLIDRMAFQGIAANLRQRFPGIQALEWIPRLSDKNVADYVARAMEDGLLDFQIKERGPGGQLMPSAAKRTYYPVYMVEPVAGNEPALGFDLGSEPMRRAMLEKARDTGQLTVTDPVNLVQSSDTSPASKVVLATYPVYRTGFPTSTVNQREHYLLGFTLGIFPLHDLVTAASEKFAEAPGFDIYVFDHDTATGTQLLHFHSAEGGSQRPNARDVLENPNYPRVTLQAGDRDWEIVFKPLAGSFVESSGLTREYFLAGGVLASILFAAYLLTLLRRDATINIFVARQTAQLRESQARLETILQIIPHGIVTADAEGRIEAANIAMEPLFGYAEEDLVGMKVSELMPADYREAHDQGLHRVATTGESRLLGRCLELEGQRSDGETFPLELTLANWSVAGQQHFTGVLQDITARKTAELGLEESEQRFKDFATSASDWFWEMDADLRFSYFSDQFHRATDLDPETMIGKTRREVVNPGPNDALWNAHLKTLDACQPFQDFEYETKDDQGGSLYMNVSGVPAFDATGNFKGYRGTGTNITIRVLAEERANQAQARLHDAIKNMPEGVALFDKNDELILSNTNFRTVYTRIKDTIVPGVSFENMTRNLITAEYVPAASGQEEAWIKRRVEHHRSPAEPVEFQLDDGKWMMAQEFPTEEGGTLIIRSDVTERKTSEELITHMARHDGLTDLPNRALCMDRLEMALAFARRHKSMCGVLFIDLDGFKAVNDGLGHEAGDFVLREVSRRLCDGVRESDTVGRIGGDEFLVVLSEVANKDAAAMVAQRLIDSLAEPIMVNKQRADIGASVGISLYPEHAGNPRELLDSADRAMYIVKKRGKNGFEFATAT